MNRTKEVVFDEFMKFRKKAEFYIHKENTAKQEYIDLFSKFKVGDRVLFVGTEYQVLSVSGTLTFENKVWSIEIYYTLIDVKKNGDVGRRVVKIPIMEEKLSKKK